MIISREWAMPNKWTFLIKPIAKLLKRVSSDYSNWADPFSGKNSPCGLTNDLRVEMPTIEHLDALVFLKKIKTNSLDGVLYDPPYSITQAKLCYDGCGLKNLSGSMSYWSSVKDEIARVTKIKGVVVCFGWNSMGLGKNRGFVMDEILLVSHGGSRNDTIVTIEHKEEETK